MHAPANQSGPISSDLLLLAYRNGIFPMADHRTDAEIYWVEPRERAIIPLDRLHLSKSLARTIRRDRFRVTCNHAFARVISSCAQPREVHAESWISERIEASYLALHRQGHAHSFECWTGGELAGGLYGVGFDRVFCGESMFSHATDASKVALAWLVATMRQAGFRVLDCQFMTDHLASMGAVAFPQAQYLEMVADAGGEADMSLEESWGVFAQASSPGKSITQSLTQTS
ncbi:MAG: leucyl/phenylalanyl-tRNA--protein transferase [Qipengyuania sp.]